MDSRGGYDSKILYVKTKESGPLGGGGVRRRGILPFPLFHIALQGSFVMVVHSILHHGLHGMAKLAMQHNPSPVPIYPSLRLALCDV